MALVKEKVDLSDIGILLLPMEAAGRCFISSTNADALGLHPSNDGLVAI